MSFTHRYPEGVSAFLDEVRHQRLPMTPSDRDVCGDPVCLPDSRSNCSRGIGGFTLLELITVMGIISILMGLGIGFLQRGSTDLDLAFGIIRDQMRLASTTAKSQSLPTEVRIFPGDGFEKPTRLQTHALRTIGHWHLEPAERWFNQQIKPASPIKGEFVAGGRFGHACRPDIDDEDAMMTIEAGDKDSWYLDGGFALRLELKLESRSAATLVRLGDAFELGMDGNAVLEARMTLGEAGKRRGGIVTLQASRTLPLHEWVTIELVHDGRELRLLTDGRVEASGAARGEPYQHKSDLFELSRGGEHVLGLIDEVRLLAYQRGELMEFPVEVELRNLQGPVRFDRRGEPVTPQQFTIILNDEEMTRVISAGGILK